LQQAIRPAAPDIWGGIECTINRVGDRYFDQLAWSGHYDRIDDLDRIAELGIRTLRYPVLWEHVAPNGLANADWTSVDRRLDRLRSLGINPIVTLVHHGSGPASTNLLDDGFAPGLAEFAGAVARRYPWIRDYTPINEPLTTARFSGLYGHWYPHKRDMPSFFRCLVNEIDATSRAMAEIRTIRPDARLIQTEDLGKTYSTPLLRYQADHENERRWLSLDLLCGRVDRGHPLRRFMTDSGVDERWLRALVESPCGPDLIGVNYYVTGERYLDERLGLYPPHTHGGNGRHAYADVEAVRMASIEIGGFEGVIREASARYGGPLAITEVHIGSTCDEQCRWLAEAWRAALAVRADGVDLRAITVWALLGAFNWHKLVTSDERHYEPGAFELRDGALRRTQLAMMTQAIVAGRRFCDPVLKIPGWWRRDERILYGREHVSVDDVVVEPMAAETIAGAAASK
jgi:dTDP-4-dehydrorhamnose reductase